MATDPNASAPGSKLFGIAGVLMALCCLAGPAALGVAAGAAIGSPLGIASAAVLAVAGVVLLRRWRGLPGKGSLMERRVLLTAFVVISTAAFVIGVSVERASGDKHTEPAAAVDSGEAAEGGAERGTDEGGGEARGEAAPAATEDENNEKLLGVDLEAWPFVALAAAFSLALAAGVWLRPQWGLLLAVVAVAMVAFAALDVREVIHQLDESKGGLALLAAVVAALHLAAAGVAALMGRSPTPARRDSPA